MLTKLSRIIRSGWINFWRNRWLSGAAISVMSLTIFVTTSLLLVNVLTSALVETLRDKIDVSVYFKLNVSEEEVLEARESLIALNEVQSVEYVSREEALKNFKEKHKENSLLMQSLDELNDNPLEASLNIKAQTASQYEQIVNFLTSSKHQKDIDKINYRQNQTIINRLSSITGAIQRSGVVVSIALALVAILVTFHTIRLAIYSSREEVNVMKLVGASNWFIRGPFVVEGALYGVSAVIIILIIFYPLVWFISPKITTYLPGSDLFYFFKVNFWQIFLIQIAVGVSLGVVSSFVAIRRYLKKAQ
ncbi:MAG: hypothetical protein A3E90_02115 [Candidatus Portnoybacteria bacterium RIFCSPHIGHO2_12_FULL_40_11]|uniref:Cell division protein FtsX n=4 Tax=Candidatus Portnoyibacteriota TaxID=1817913 RepID=A0A1G2FJ22_9BACT|nr:MAG: hypothetical protein A3E90_02115 [Candidatus Portnoybacteria bacterium RIFCSPHIGHO2_12_FULL_40_11]